MAAEATAQGVALMPDNLQKKLMIAEIERSITQRRFFTKVDILMSPMKEFFCMYVNKFQVSSLNMGLGIQIYCSPILQ